MKKVLISGGSGLIGRHLTDILLQNGYAVAWLSRSVKPYKDVNMYKWDVDAGYIDPEAILWADVLVHLAGESIAGKRWTAKRKQAIIESRTKSTELLIAAMQQHNHHIEQVVAASAIGFYGETGENSVDETNSSGNGFLSESVRQWEDATSKFSALGVNLVTLRIGIVLAENGGALKEIVQTKSLRVLPVMGSGKQIYAWIHIQDVGQIIMYCLQQKLSGIYNAVAPNPVSLKSIIQHYQQVSGKWYVQMPVPTFALKLILGELSAVVLTGQNVSSAKIQSAGYQFSFPDITSALTQIIKA